MSLYSYTRAKSLRPLSKAAKTFSTQSDLSVCRSCPELRCSLFGGKKGLRVGLKNVEWKMERNKVVERWGLEVATSATTLRETVHITGVSAFHSYLGMVSLR